MRCKRQLFKRQQNPPVKGRPENGREKERLKKRKNGSQSPSGDGFGVSRNAGRDKGRKFPLRKTCLKGRQTVGEVERPEVFKRETFLLKTTGVCRGGNKGIKWSHTPEGGKGIKGLKV